MLQTYLKTKLEIVRIQSISGPKAGFRFFKIRRFWKIIPDLYLPNLELPN